MNKLEIYLGDSKMDTIEMNYMIDLSDKIMKVDNGLYSVVIYYTNSKGKKEIQKEYKMWKYNNIYELYTTKDKNKRYWRVVSKKIFDNMKICCDMVIQITPIYGSLYHLIINNIDKMIDKKDIYIIDSCGIDIQTEISKILKYYEYNISSIKINGNDSMESYVEDELEKKDNITLIEVDIDQCKAKNIIGKIISCFKK